MTSRLDWGLTPPPGQQGPIHGPLHGVLAGVEVQVKVKGPALVDKRGSSWILPRMTPGDRARRKIGIKVNGWVT